MSNTIRLCTIFYVLTLSIHEARSQQANPALPPAPQNLSFKLQEGKIQLQWKKVAGAVQYNVKTSTEKNGVYSLLSSGPQTNYVQSGFSNGEVYFYKVSSLNAQGLESRDSEILEVKPNMTISAPELKVGIESKTTRLRWSKVSGAGTYFVKRAQSESGPFERIAKSETALEFVDEKVKPSKTYFYTVTALSSEGVESNPSKVQKIDFPAENPEVEKVALAPTVIPSQSGALVSWKPTKGAETYTLKRSTSESGAFQKVGNFKEVKATDTSISRGETYFYKVTAVRNGVESPDSPVSLPFKFEVPVKMVTLRVSNVANGVKVSWDSNPLAASIRINRSLSQNSFTVLTTVNGANEYTDQTVTRGETYYYSIEGVGENKDVVLKSIPTKVIYSPPSEKVVSFLAAAANTEAGLRISWQRTQPEQSVRIKRAVKKEGPFALLETIKNANEYFDTTATRGESYFYSLEVVNSVTDTVAHSEPIQIEYKPGVLAAPANLVAEKEEYKIRLKWKPVPNALSYFVKRSLAETGPFTLIGKSEKEATFLDKDVSGGQLYHYVVTANNKNGESPNSESVKILPNKLKQVGKTVQTSLERQPASASEKQ